MKLRPLFCALIGAGLFATLSTAGADTTIVYVNAGDDGVQTGKTQISDGRVVVSSPGDGYAIFDTNKEQFITINEADKSYMVMDQAQIQKIVDMQQQVMAQMESQLSALPASQRAQMKKMMSSMMPKVGGEAKPRSYERSGETKEIAGYDCEVIEVYSGDRKASQQCVTSADELDIPEEDYATIRSMMDFVMDLSNSFGQISDEFLDFGEPGKDEFPVEFIHYGKISGTSTGQLKSVSFDDIDPALLEIPAGYKEMELPDMGDLGL
ncbi:MAG: DUF4412 domain-containing protein [Lysobacterales bacterium]